GLVVCGFGIAVHFPLGMALAIDHSDGQADLATARSAYAFGFAFGVAPFLLAAIADQIDPHTAFLLVPVFLAVAAVAILPIARGGPGGASAGRRDSSVPEVGELQPERSQ
ncbi:MAG: hypothetical protein JXA67_04420, partial [Micromonosporaceae bacterium]|nr:hypothetical protein [Micromonosporaceae bacterium]